MKPIIDPHRHDNEGEFVNPEAADQSPSEADDTRAAISGWGLSLALHAIVLLLLAFVVIAGRMIEDYPPQPTAHIEPPPPPVDQDEPERDIIESVVAIDVAIEVDTTVVEVLDVEVTEVQTPDDEPVDNPINANEDAVAVSETGSVGAFMAIGAGSNSAGLFALRGQGGRARAVSQGGGSRLTETTVDAALRWFARHQSPNGMWDVTDYGVNCDLPGPKGEPGTAYTGADGDAAATGYAVLAFLGGGHDHRSPNRYRRHVTNGLNWLVANQLENGGFGRDRNYENAICAMALAEAYAMTYDPSLRQPAQRAITHLVNRQIDNGNGYGGYGWDYQNSSSRNDSSVSGWVVMALKSAEAGDLDVGQGMNGARRFFEGAWKAANAAAGLQPSNHYEDVSVFPYVWNQLDGSVQKVRPGDLSPGNGARTAVGLCMGIFLGFGQGDIAMETLANEVMRTHLPSYASIETANQYWLYYNMLGMFQIGGDRWNEFNRVVSRTLVNSQHRSDDCFDGSWDYQYAGNNWHGNRVGRLVSTAYNALSLQVYYRYVRAHKP